MTKNLVSKDSLRDGETSADFFRRVAREKMPPREGRCHYCGQDHRGPQEYWPEDELERHLNARDNWAMWKEEEERR